MLTVVEETEFSTILLDEIKEYLNEINSDKDAEITSMIDAVVNDAEDITNRKLSPTTYELYLPKLYDGFKLPKNPITSIVKIEYMDENEAYQLLDDSKYYLYEKHEIGTIKLKEQFRTIAHEKAVKITFNCGYEHIPAPILNWIKYKVMCLYDGKEENISKYVNSLLDKYRIRNV